MPSAQLSSLCEQIEKQNTDHFGKFYMYVSLLNTVAVRNKTYMDCLPKYENRLFALNKDKLNVGEIPDKFIQQVNSYVIEFINTQPTIFNAIKSITLDYLRQGKTTDLMHIIDQILFHLTATQGSEKANNKIYKSIDFDNKKGGLNTFILQVSAFNKHLLSTLDSGMNAGISTLVLASGLVMLLVSVFTIIPAVIGLGLTLGGTIATYHYVTQTQGMIDQLEPKMKQIFEKARNLPQDKSFFGDRNHSEFFTSVLQPFSYAGIAMMEQLMPTEEKQKEMDNYRQKLDMGWNILSKM